MHEYYAKPRGERREGDRTLLKPNMGPPNSFARTSVLPNYNGEQGGHVFRWYHKARFEKQLNELGTTVGTASENIFHAEDMIVKITPAFEHPIMKFISVIIFYTTFIY